MPVAILLNHHRKKSIIPNAYRQLTCIIANGAQYINTWCALFSSNTWEMDLDFATPTSTGYNPIWGVFGGALYRAWYTSPTFYFRYNNSNATLVANAVVGRRYYRRCVYNGSTLRITDENGSVISSPTITTGINTNYVTLFLYPNGHYGTMKLYACKMYRSGTLERDFYPVIRKSDSVVGLYDAVSKSFFTNAGSGSFSYEA